jgi:hypothetical protein
LITAHSLPLRSTEEAICAAADAIRGQMIVVGSGDCAWVSGSTFDGLGHGTSDLDVFVATPEIAASTPITRRHVGFGVHAFIEGRTRFDVEYWELSFVRGLAQKLASMEVENPQVNLVGYFSRWETEFIHRLFIGVPLIDPEAVDGLRSMFDRVRLGWYLYDTALHFYDNSYEDCVGMLEAGQLEGAAIQARSVAGYAIDALLAASGSTSGQEKFRPQRLRRLLRDRAAGDESLFTRFWAVETGIPSTTQALDTYIRETLAYSESIFRVVQDAVEARRQAHGNGGDALLDEIPAGLFRAPEAIAR